MPPIDPPPGPHGSDPDSGSPLEGEPQTPALWVGAPDRLPTRSPDRPPPPRPTVGPLAVLCGIFLVVGFLLLGEGARSVEIEALLATPPPLDSPLLEPHGRDAFLEAPPHGLALGLYSMDPAYDYDPALAEIAVTGANAVELVVNHYQRKVDSIEVGVFDRRTAPWARVRRTIEQAHARGLRVHLMPILLIQEPGPDDWRGTLAPSDRAAWHRSYRRWIVDLAVRAQEVDLDALCIGSEFNSLQGDRDEWLHTIAAVRAVFDGAITYSANWDSYAEVPFLDALDALGMTTYHPLADHREPELDTLIASWLPLRSQLVRWQRATGVPMFFTEVGYPSIDGAAMHPWDYTAPGDPDPIEQHDCLRSFEAVWRDVDALGGVFFYVWWGVGGPLDRGYTPRGKPGLEVIERWFRLRAGH